MIRKFKATVRRENEYEIEIDDSVWTAEEIKEWESSFYRTRNLEALAGHIAASLTQHEGDHGIFIEGFGIIKCLYGDGSPANQISGDREFAPALSATIVIEDSEYEIEVDEIKPKP